MKSDSIRRVCLGVMAASVLVLLLCFVGSFTSPADFLKSPIFKAASRWIPHAAVLTGAVASWVQRRYPQWKKDTSRPGGRPVMNEESRSLPVWLLVFTMVVPPVAIAAALVSISLLLAAFGLLDESLRPAPVIAASGGLTVLFTAAYAVVVARRLRTLEKARGYDVALSFIALFAILSSVSILLVTRGDVELLLRGHPWLTALCGLSILITSIYAIVMTVRFKPRDKWGRAEEISWLPAKKRHA